jgi:hypothetical protein
MHAEVSRREIKSQRHQYVFPSIFCFSNIFNFFTTMLYFSPLVAALSNLFIQVAFSAPQATPTNVGQQFGGQIGGGLCNLGINCCGGCHGDPSIGHQFTFNCTNGLNVSAFSAASCVFAVSIFKIAPHSSQEGLYVLAMR